MSDEPKSIWRKPWRGPIAWAVGWLVLMVATAIIFGVIMAMFKLRGSHSNEEVWLVVMLETVITLLMLTVVLVCWLIRWLSHWRNVKRLLFCVACVATLAGLFYAEEDWRGRRAWRNYVNEWSARGEFFELKDIVPPPVPEDRNFAMTPVAQTFYDFILTRDGKVIPAEQRKTLPAPRTEFDLGGDWTWQTNAIGNWAMGTMSRLDLWQQHYRELAAQTNQFPVPAQPGTPAADVLLALSKYDATVEEIRQAAKLPACRFPLDYDNEDPAAILLPHLAALKRTSLLLRLRALAELENGQSDKAAADVLLTLRLADYIRDEPTYISLLVRAAMTDIALQPVYEGLAKHRWTEAQLAAIESELARLDYLADVNTAVRWERVFSGGVIDYITKRDTRRRYAELFRIMYEDDFSRQVTDDYVDYKAVGVALTPMGWVDLNRLAIARFHERWTLPAVDPEKHQVNTTAADEMVWHAQHLPRTPMNFMVKWFVIGLGNGPHKFACVQSSVDLARVAVALERHRLAQGAYPETLEVLAPKYLAKLPDDVIGGQPLKYRREADGRFVLYAVGWNGKDDGGVTANADGSIRSDFGEVIKPDFDHGDWVWRYPK